MERDVTSTSMVMNRTEINVVDVNNMNMIADGAIVIQQRM